MTEFHVLDKVQSLSHCDVAKCLEEHHGYRPSRKHVTNHELGQHVESELRVGGTLNHADWDEEDNGEQERNDQRPPSQMSVPDQDRDHRQGEQNSEQGIVPPIWCVSILAHHLEMDISILVPRQLPALNDLGTVEDGRVYNDGRQGAKGDTVCEGEERPQEERRVLLVSGNIECLLGRQDLCHVVRRTRVVERVCLYGKIRKRVT